jgi:hypothetical protein
VSFGTITSENSKIRIFYVKLYLDPEILYEKSIVKKETV